MKDCAKPTTALYSAGAVTFLYRARLYVNAHVYLENVILQHSRKKRETQLFQLQKLSSNKNVHGMVHI